MEEFPLLGWLGPTRSGAVAPAKNPGDVAPPQPAFLAAGISAAQVIATGGRVELDTIHASSGDAITLDTSSNVGRFTLQGGRKYAVVAAMSASLVAASGVSLVVWDADGAAEVGRARSRVWHPADTSAATAGCQTLVRVLAPAVTTDYEIRILASQFTVRPEATSLSIFEVGV